MQKTGLTKGRVSQLFDESQPFGELAARNLAEKLGLAQDYFERPVTAAGGNTLSTQALEVAEAFDRLSLPERRRFLRLLTAAQDESTETQWVGDIGTLKAGKR